LVVVVVPAIVFQVAVHQADQAAVALAALAKQVVQESNLHGGVIPAAQVMDFQAGQEHLQMTVQAVVVVVLAGQDLLVETQEMQDQGELVEPLLLVDHPCSMQAVAVVVFIKTRILQELAATAAQEVVEQVEAVQMVPRLIDRKQAQIKARECQDNGLLVAVRVAAAGKVQILKAESAALELLL
jgi:hypothetical protein